MDKTKKKSRDTIQSLQTGLSIIDCMAKENRPLRVAEIQQLTGITKSNLYKYLNTLVQGNWIFRDDQSGLYHLGTKLMQYGMLTRENQNIIELITPYLQAITNHTNNTTLFAIPTYKGPIISKIWRSNHSLNIGAELGTELPENSAAGKVLRVFANQKIIDKWKSDKVFSLHENTPEFHEIKKNKIAFSTEPLISEVSSVAFPILLLNEELIGMLAIVGFHSNIPTDMNSPISKYLQNMQTEISDFFNPA